MGRISLFGVVATTLALATANYSAASDFQIWLGELSRRAVQDGVSPDLVSAAFRDLELSPEVIRLERKQPEFTETLSSYLDRVVPRARVSEGRKRMRRHRKILDQIGAAYEVQPRFIVALWAIESDYGRYQGRHPTVQSLATLGFQGRRRQFFQGELLHLLHVLEGENLDPSQLSGSWAGAIGQCQFMPSTFRRLAVDHDGDGKRNIWDSPADIFASIANYLSHLRWRDDQTWGRQVLAPREIREQSNGLETSRSLVEWQSLGVRRLDGTDLPKRDIDAALLVPERAAGRTYLVYRDFRILLRWNNSVYFALSVGRLADMLTKD